MERAQRETIHVGTWTTGQVTAGRKQSQKPPASPAPSTSIEPWINAEEGGREAAALQGEERRGEERRGEERRGEERRGEDGSAASTQPASFTQRGIK
ncbi:hypothetical protein llap_7071 [Limosa lapponica baueri]|uniref:Uncharacterized protein n=1 Tax=Limosa lapponica baueri TaxID=1758121 RepID=A0A2I0U9A3_LIMLA|nr:hypothetical protein llap_7071 [Limosa lapponica baueri]